MEEFFQMIGGWPLWVKLLALLIALGLILLIWQPWSKGGSSSSATTTPGWLSSTSPGSPPPPSPPPAPGPGPTGSQLPPLPAQVLQGSGYWVGQQAAATTPIETAQGTFGWISPSQFTALAAQRQPIFYEPLPGDFVQLPYNQQGQVNLSGLVGKTPLYAEEPSQANSSAG